MAEDIAADATQRTSASQNVRELQQAKALWQEAVDKLKVIPSDSLIIDRATRRTQEYNAQIKDIEDKIIKILANPPAPARP